MALERNDVSQWPKGIYRRAYLRDYATAIGLPPEQVLAEFLRLFPEDDQLPPPLVKQPADQLRLTLAVERRPGVRLAFMRGLATIRDSRLVLLAGKIAAWLGCRWVGFSRGKDGRVVECSRGKDGRFGRHARGYPIVGLIKRLNYLPFLLRPLLCRAAQIKASADDELAFAQQGS